MKQLNPIIWYNNKLRADIKEKLLQIKDKFIEGLNENNIPTPIVDIVIVGSNASYNYTEQSDLDLHIRVDLYSFPDEKQSLLKLIYNYYKSSFNDKYDIQIKGIPVELYIEDMNGMAISNGAYSILYDKWIVEPIYKEYETTDISKSLNYMIERFEEVKLLEDVLSAQIFLDMIYENRARSLIVDGEYGIDNLIFKEFRNRGYIQELKDIIRTGESRELSLESLSKKLNENYYTIDGKEFWDYGTDDVEYLDYNHQFMKSNIFDTSTLGGYSQYNDYLHDPAYIQKITPNEYYEQAAKGFNTTVNQLIKRSEADKESLQHIRDVLLIAGKKLPMTYISKSDGSKQEGLHRMYIAGEMFGWNKSFPVLVLP